VLEIPAIEVVPVTIEESFYESIKSASYLMFSSSQAVNFLDTEALQAILNMGKKVISIGEKTSQALMELGFEIFYESAERSRDALGKALSEKLLPSDTICHLCSHITEVRPAEFLTEYGLTINNLCTYTTLLPEASRAVLQEQTSTVGMLHLYEKEAVAVTYFSSSAVRNFHALLKENNSELIRHWNHFAFGTSTYHTLKEYYSKKIFMAAEPSISSLIQAIKEQRKYEI